MFGYAALADTYDIQTSFYDTMVAQLLFLFVVLPFLIHAV